MPSNNNSSTEVSLESALNSEENELHLKLQSLHLKEAKSVSDAFFALLKKTMGIVPTEFTYDQTYSKWVSIPNAHSQQLQYILRNPLFIKYQTAAKCNCQAASHTACKLRTSRWRRIRHYQHRIPRRRKFTIHSNCRYNLSHIQTYSISCNE